MIHGLNFGQGQIPDEYLKVFKKRKMFGNQAFTLVGVCQSQSEKDYMILVASNGRRLLQTVEGSLKGNTVFGVYAY
jgi:hypothetical protein